MPFRLKQRSIIAMKGLPFTGKTECANLIAASLKCPVFSLDDFLDDLHPHHCQNPRDAALQIICRISKSHLMRGLVDNIVIDSPLSSRSHLDQLIKLASEAPETRLVIIQCKPKNVYMWQNKFEAYANANSESLACKWYKAKNWNEVITEINNDYDERVHNYSVPKLILDPLSGFKMELCSRIYYRLLTGLSVEDESPSFMEAISYMITRDEGQGHNLVVYDEWRQSRLVNKESGQGFCVGDSHNINIYTDEFDSSETFCTVCEQLVTGEAYTCTSCSLALHKKCVESCSMIQPPRFTWDELHWDCVSCNPGVTSVYYMCSTCRFKFNLKTRAYKGLPSVCSHDCEEHFLWIDMSPDIDMVKCMACGGEISQPTSTGEPGNTYSCKICDVVYHGKCLTEVAARVKHVHGGHHHSMILKFSITDEEEDYICLECLEKRDPQLWFYSCEECPYEIHLDCALQGEYMIY